MPSLGADMDAGTLVEWRITPGSKVHRGDVVALVETQKGIVEVEIWQSGVIDTLVVAPGSKVPVGTVLATLRDGVATPAEARPMLAESPPTPATPATPATPPMTGDGVRAAASDGIAAATLLARPPVPRASPAARQLAREHGIDLAAVTATGPHGTITRSDVERRLAGGSKPTPSPRTPGFDAAAMRDAIGAAMARSKREIPHYYLGVELDVSRAMTWLEAANADRSVTERVLFAAVLLRATALALREVPELNGRFVDGVFHWSPDIHLGVAIALRGGGLVAPAIHDADDQPLDRIMHDLHDLVSRARTGMLRSSEMSDPTITVTNLGEKGTDIVHGVIYPPQVALVGFGRVRQRPWAENGLVGVRPIVWATLAGDHRVSDGHRGARFLGALERRLAEPEKL